LWANDFSVYNPDWGDGGDMAGTATLERAEQVVAKKKAVQPRNDEAVRIRSDVASKARIAAAFAGESITDYLSNLLEPLLTKAIDEGYARTKKSSSRSHKPTE
jgi:hypothetical protein